MRGYQKLSDNWRELLESIDYKQSLAGLNIWMKARSTREQSDHRRSISQLSLRLRLLLAQPQQPGEEDLITVDVVQSLNSELAAMEEESLETNEAVPESVESSNTRKCTDKGIDDEGDGAKDEILKTNRHETESFTAEKTNDEPSKTNETTHDTVDSPLSPRKRARISLSPPCSPGVTTSSMCTSSTK